MFNSTISLPSSALAWLRRLAQRLLAQPSGWVSASSALAHGDFHGRMHLNFRARFYAPRSA